MDTLSHGLWGGIMFGKRNKRSFWLSFAFGVLPDLLVFTPTFIAILLATLTGAGDGFNRPPDPESLPQYVQVGYSFTHSLIVFAIVFIAAWLIRRRPLYEMLAWPAHILLDLPTHSSGFFPTPYLWPFTHPELDGVPWSHPLIFIPNVVLLIILYGWHFYIRPKYRAWKGKRTIDVSTM